MVFVSLEMQRFLRELQGYCEPQDGFESPNEVIHCASRHDTRGEANAWCVEMVSGPPSRISIPIEMAVAIKFLKRNYTLEYPNLLSSQGVDRITQQEQLR